MAVSNYEAAMDPDAAEATGKPSVWVLGMRKWWTVNFEFGGATPPEKIEVSPEFYAALAADVRAQAYGVYPDVADIDGTIKFRNRPVVARV